MGIKFITEYIEFGGNDGSLLGQYQILSSEEKLKILDYLKESEIIATRCSLIKDYVKGFQTTLGIKVHTDGEYEWSDDEIYHFDNYNIKLNEDFITKVLNKKM